MKYMTFNSSCSYAGLANLLSFHGIDTEDRVIALKMGLPYLFAYEDGQYLSGPMLQGAKWFNLYLNPLGLTLSERSLSREEVCPYLQANPPAMLGLRVSPESKHAVIYTGQKDGLYQFLNNKRQNSPEPETLSLTESDLLSRLDEQAVVGALERTAPTPVNYRPYLEKSVLVLQDLEREINAFCTQEQFPDSLRGSMNNLFRPILLDGMTMLELLEETEIAEPLRIIRTQLLSAIRADHPVVLHQALDMPQLNAAIVQYQKLITERMKAE